ncbi:MAG: phosphomannomutase/phosphoglucomutase [Gammaproteobacteria bacterium]|nr:phosphomannomutase/phosphoglucomutase [Gammaproteobacteria bacterium]
MIWGGVGLLVLLVAGAGLVVLRKWKKTQKFDPEAAGVLGGAISTMGEDATRPVDTMVDSYLARTDAKEPPPGSEEQENLDVGLDDSLGDGITELPTGVVYGLDTDTGMNVELTETEGISAAIFRAYDIRGIVGDTLTVEAARSIGQAIGSEAYERGQQAVVVGRDGRLSSQEMASALIEGLRASGRDVIDVGQVPTPVLYFAADYLEAESGVMVTGSHNPPNYNGFKIMLGGETLSGDAISAIRGRLGGGNLMTGEGSLQSMDVGAEYIRRVSEDIPVALGGAYKLVVDCGNGVAGEVAPRVYRALGHDVIELYCEVDGNFPNHHPDPIQPENLTDLIRKVREENADLGLAFDGDGDRLVVVDGEGNIIWPDRLLMFFAEDILSRHSGAEVIFDVKCSNRLFRVIEKLGGKPVMWKSGHSLIKQKMKETGAALAGELSGHIFIQDRWYGFDDALYAGARLLEMLRNSKGPPAQTFKHYTTGITTPELRVNMAEGEPHRLMEQLSGQTGLVEGATIIDIDGIRADWPDGWGLVRASNTTPSLVLRFEGDDEAALGRVQEQFRKMLLTVEPGLKLPF